MGTRPVTLEMSWGKEAENTDCLAMLISVTFSKVSEPGFPQLKTPPTLTDPMCRVHDTYKDTRAMVARVSGARQSGGASAPTSMGFTVIVKAESSQSISFSFPESWSLMVR